MAIKTLKDVLAFALKKAEDPSDRTDLLEILDAIEGAGNGDIDPRVDILDGISVEIVDEVIAQTDESLFSELSTLEKSEILDRAFTRHSKYGTHLIDAISIELQNFSLIDEGSSL